MYFRKSQSHFFVISVVKRLFTRLGVTSLKHEIFYVIGGTGCTHKFLREPGFRPPLKNGLIGYVYNGTKINVDKILITLSGITY